jgi:hypothetical protein
MSVRTAVSEGLVVFACAFPAWAQETPIDIRGCGTSERAIIDKAGDVVIGVSVFRGVTDSAPAGGPLDKSTHECRSVWTSSKAGFDFTNRCTNVDRDGDKVFWETSGTPQAMKTRIFAGTGKYEGISGRMEARFDTLYPATPSGTSGGCWTAKGGFSLKK